MAKNKIRNRDLGAMSRRHAIASVAQIGAGAAVLSGVRMDSSQEASPTATAFALIGDPSHEYNMIRSALTKTLVEGAGLTIDFTNEVSQLTAETIKRYRMIVLLREHTPALTAKQQNAVSSFVGSGGAGLFLHNSSALSRFGNEAIRHVIGGAFITHSPVRTYKVEITDKNHPITRGVGDFTIVDEQHFVVYDKDARHVLMRNVDPEGGSWHGHGSTSHRVIEDCASAP
jgi:hypothetical protein